MRYDKKAILTRAKELLSSDKEEDLRYACLELRMCIEMICYEKLKLYQNQIPEELLKTWQPQKVVESLLEYAPDADKDFHLIICKEGQDGKPIGKPVHVGQHKAITLKFIKEAYHKLGYYLHVPTIAQQNSQKYKDADDLRNELNSIASKMEELCSSTIDSNFGSVITFHCQYCSNIIIRNKKGLDKKKSLVCPECKAEYDFYYEGEAAMFKPRQISYTCPDCHTEYFLGKHLLEEGAIIHCNECSAKFVLQQQWTFGRLPE